MNKTFGLEVSQRVKLGEHKQTVTGTNVHVPVQYKELLFMSFFESFPNILMLFMFSQSCSLFLSEVEKPVREICIVFPWFWRRLAWSNLVGSRGDLVGFWLRPRLAEPSISRVRRTTSYANKNNLSGRGISFLNKLADQLLYSFRYAQPVIGERRYRGSWVYIISADTNPRKKNKNGYGITILI